MADVVGAWWAQPSMPTWWGDRPQSISRSRRIRSVQQNSEVWRSSQTMSGHLADTLGVDPHNTAHQHDDQWFSEKPTTPQTAPVLDGGRRQMKRANMVGGIMASMKRPSSTPDLRFGGITTHSTSRNPEVPLGPLRLKGKPTSTDSSTKHRHRACSAVFNLRVNHYNIANQLQRKRTRNAGVKEVVPGNRKWPTTELREAIKCRLAEEDYDDLTQLRVGVIRADCEQVLSLDIGALRAHPDFLQIVAEEAMRRTEELNTMLLSADVEGRFRGHDKDESHGHDDSWRSSRPGSPLVDMGAITSAYGATYSCKNAKDNQMNIEKKLGKAPSHKNKSQNEDNGDSEFSHHLEKSGHKKGDKDLLVHEDPSWIAAFGKLKEDGEVHRDQLGRALEIVGFEKPKDAWIEQSIRATVGNTATLNQDEFCRVLRNYSDQQVSAWRKDFTLFDEDNSNSIEANELAHLLQKSGTTPFPDVLAEIVDEVDEDGTGSLSFEEFVQVLGLLRKREGFAQREINNFNSAFDRYRVVPHQEISTESIFDILVWLGYSPDVSDIEELVSETDSDRSGKLNRSEFLHAMRIYREREIARIRAFFVANDVDKSGTLGKSELLVLMSQLGYTVRAEVLKELASDVHSDVTTLELSFESFWILLKFFRQRQGYLSQEIARFKEVFLRYASKQGQLGVFARRDSMEKLDIDDPDLEMGTVQLGKALRWMGYATTLDQQAQMVHAIDVDQSGALSFAEFVKLMRRWDAMCQLIVKKHFDRADSDGDGLVGSHCSSELAEALRALGHVPTKERVYKVVEARSLRSRGQAVDFAEFERLVNQYREADTIALRDTAGFHENAVQRFRLLFDKYDKDHSGDIQNGELAKLLGDVFPASMTSVAERGRLQSLLKEVDVNGDGRLDFGDFIILMRQYQDKKDEEQLDKERIAVEECNFTRPEVEQFRSIFHGSTAEGGLGNISSMSLAEVRRVLARVVPVSEAQVTELSNIIKEVSKGTSVITGFPEFLRLMKRLQDDNFANINGAAAEIAQRERQYLNIIG